jgi:hypothetical protein
VLLLLPLEIFDFFTQLEQLHFTFQLITAFIQHGRITEQSCRFAIPADIEDWVELCKSHKLEKYDLERFVWVEHVWGWYGLPFSGPGDSGSRVFAIEREYT